MSGYYYVTMYNENSFKETISHEIVRFYNYNTAVKYIKSWLKLKAGYKYNFSRNGEQICIK